MTRLILTLPESWTPKLAREQMDRYERLIHEHRKAIDARDWKRQDHVLAMLEEVADEIIEAAVMRGAWRVEADEA